MTATGDRLSLDELCIDTIRTLSIDAVQKANQGHPGAPMGLAPVAYTLYTRLMRHNPANPLVDRPRPLHPVRRPRVDAAVFVAVPGRLSDHARGPRELPSARLADRRSPRELGRSRHRGDDRPARPGHLDGRRSRARRADARRALQRRRPRRRRPPHLGDRLRRRHPGGHRVRGVARSPATSASAS